MGKLSVEIMANLKEIGKNIKNNGGHINAYYIGVMETYFKTLSSLHFDKNEILNLFRSCGIEYEEFCS